MDLIITEFKVREKNYKERSNKTVIHFFHENESILENLMERHSRPSKLYKELFPKIKAKLSLSNDIEATWSQKAGCSCGCSPGFIVKNPAACMIDSLISKSLWRKDIYVTIATSIQTELKLLPRAQAA